MSLQTWAQNGWLLPHATSAEEIANLFAIIERDLKDCQVQGLSSDARLERAYNAALQAATAALYVSGYRVRGQEHHYRVIQSLELTLQDAKVATRLDAFRKKRNRLNYERAGAASDREVEEMIRLAQALRSAVASLIKQVHPEYLPSPKP
jgi:hypothetical protein